jgi:rfaE bifunctional protein nucleotidyltransferase chain/domain
VADSWVVTPNASEARGFARAFEQQRAFVFGEEDAGHEPRSALGLVAADAMLLRRSWSARAVAITRGPDGAVLAGPTGSPVLIPCRPEAGGDTCGAGDRFAAALLEALCRRSTTEEAVGFAVETARAYVASGGVSVVRPVAGKGDSDGPAGQRGRATPLREAASRADEVRSRGGAVVAAGGCFDLLHPGHVRLLAEAGRLGDLLVVLVNGDASVRRLKGPGRPIQPALDRAAVLSALDAVDLVVVFEEDTPVEALRVLTPDLFVKGGDYAATDLPEARLLESWGGHVVVLPYVAGHSTTRLVEEVNARAS